MQISPGRIVFVGGGLVIGGSVDRAPARYDKAIVQLLRSMQAEPWQNWWGPPEQDLECQLFVWYGGRRTGHTYLRRNPKWVTACIERTDLGGLDPGPAAALADAEELVTKLAKRFDLPPRPPLPSVASAISAQPPPGQ